MVDARRKPIVRWSIVRFPQIATCKTVRRSPRIHVPVFSSCNRPHCSAAKKRVIVGTRKCEVFVLPIVSRFNGFESLIVPC